MKFKTSRQIISKEINKIVSREMKKQKFLVGHTAKIDLKEILAVSKAIEKTGLPKNLVCKKLSNGLGHGIFLRCDAKPILKGQVIAPYAGVVTIVPQNRSDDAAYAFEPLSDFFLTKEEQKIHDSKNKFHPNRHYALKVDALKKGNFTRFINHSEKPNVAAHLLCVPPNSFGLDQAPLEVIYMAKKTIHPGEQLLVSYEDGEKSYWSVLNIKPVPMFPTTFMITPSLKLIKSKEDKKTK